MPFSRVVPSGQVALGKNSLRRSCFLAVEYLFGYHIGYAHTRLSLSGRNTLVSVETLPVTKSEFTVTGERIYDRRSPVRWIVSHVLRYKRWLATFLLGTLLTTLIVSAVPALTGAAFNEVLKPNGSAEQLFLIFLAILGLVVAQAILDPLGVAGSEFIAQRIERDAREELYISLLGKSQTFHNRQQVGDIMARATNDVRQLNAMMNPGVSLILGSLLSLAIPILFIGLLNPALLVAPLLFTVAFALAVYQYNKRLNPVSGAMRDQFGVMNAGLAETITGIEVVKSTRRRSRRRASSRATPAATATLREQGEIQARYLPDCCSRWRSSVAFCRALARHAGTVDVGGWSPSWA